MHAVAAHSAVVQDLVGLYAGEGVLDSGAHALMAAVLLPFPVGQFASPGDVF